MEKVNWERLAAVAICILFGVLCVFVLFRYALVILLPFLVGIALGSTVRGPAAFIGKKTGISKKLWGAFFFLFMLLII